MRPHVPRLAVVALLAVAVGAEAQAPDRQASRFDLAVYAGGSLTGDWFQSRTVRLDGSGQAVENDDGEGYAPGYAPVFGVHAAFWLTPALGLRLHGAYAPMRPPNTDGAFDDAGESSSYTLNTWLYDLDLVLRPFAARADAGAWLSSVYLWIGGGGLTVDVAGEDRTACSAGLVPLGACLSMAPEQATVGQGTAGAGIDLLPLGPVALFGEAGVHVHDSPVHVDDEWLGPITAPVGSTVRIADDRVAVTGRLVIGLKAKFGNLLPPPPPVIPPAPPVRPLPPPAAPPAPPPPTTRAIRVCVVENGMLRDVDVAYVVATGDTLVDGRPFAERYPATAGYAAAMPFYIGNEPVMVGGRRYVKYGLPRVLAVSEVTRVGEVMGVSVFAEAGAMDAPGVIYLPVRPGCEFQPYQLEVKAGAVRG